LKSKDIHLRGIKEVTLQKIDRQVDMINARYQSNQSHEIRIISFKNTSALEKIKNHQERKASHSCSKYSR